MGIRRKFLVFNERLVRIETFFATVLIIASTLIICWQVICRYLLYISTPWAEEIARFMYVSFSWLSGGIGIYLWNYVSIDLIDVFIRKWSEKRGQIPEKLMNIVTRFDAVVVLAVSATFLWFYIQYFFRITAINPKSIVLRIPMSIPYSFVMIGTVLIIAHSIVVIAYSPDERVKFRDEYRDQNQKRKEIRSGKQFGIDDSEAGDQK